jgi:Glycosyltransferase
MRRIIVNARSLSTPLTGVQRYTRELLARWNGYAEQITPESPLRGIKGHAWEQVVLPRRLNHTLLFSPSNSGPLEVSKQVLTIHDVVYFDHPETLNRRFAAWFQFLLPKLARRVRRIITVSNFVKERVIAKTGVPPEKVVVIPNGVAPRFCPEAIAQREKAIATLGIPSGRYVLALGSIEPRKNIGRLLRAWNHVEDSIPNDVWLVVAGGQGNPAIFRSASTGILPARVFFTGHVADDILPGLCAGALAMAYPSIYEGFGLPTLEAMASGVPVIAGKCGALQEVVGDAGILIDPFDENAIGEALIRMVEGDQLRAQLRARGFVRAQEFSWDRSASATWDVLQQAADSS